MWNFRGILVENYRKREGERKRETEIERAIQGLLQQISKRNEYIVFISSSTMIRLKWQTLPMIQAYNSSFPADWINKPIKLQLDFHVKKKSA